LKEEQALLSDKAKGEKQAIIDTKIKTLQDFDKKTREELMGEGNDMLTNIQKDIEKVVSEYSKEQGYDLVLNSRVLLYGKEEYDFTGEILNRLNAAPAAAKKQ
ncbi:MAG: OmpH family outer membrane protein, partial [Candidatus Omnitrophota bacterium]